MNSYKKEDKGKKRRTLKKKTLLNLSKDNDSNKRKGILLQRKKLGVGGRKLLNLEIKGIINFYFGSKGRKLMNSSHRDLLTI